jgi:hypothetical protein
MCQGGDAAYGGFSDKRHAGELFATRRHGKNKAGAGLCASRATAATACRTGERRRVAVLLELGDGGVSEGERLAPLLRWAHCNGGEDSGTPGRRAQPSWARLVDRTC